MEFSKEDLEVIKAALITDIKDQRKQLDEMQEHGGSDIRFEIWLHKTMHLYNRVADHLNGLEYKELSKQTSLKE